MINEKGNVLQISLFTHHRGLSALMKTVLEFRRQPKCLNTLEEMLLRMLVDDLLVSHSVSC